VENLWIDRYRFKNQPFAHQKKYLEQFWKRPVAALFADMGTGKSFMVINNLAMLYDVGKINSALIIAPKGVYRNWVDEELPKHLPDHVIHRTALWTPNPRKAEKARARKPVGGYRGFKDSRDERGGPVDHEGLRVCKAFCNVYQVFYVYRREHYDQDPYGQACQKRLEGR
jgi:SNF2 family DNA or RNA helicase